MLSIEYELSVPGFPADEIGYGALVRARHANLQIQLTNDSQTHLHGLNVRPVVESYVGHNKPMLFLSVDTQIVNEIPPKSMVSLTFRIYAHYPGLIAVAIHITDVTGQPVMAKRAKEEAYEQSPVRYWFYVVDSILIETLRTVKALLAQTQKYMKKPKETKK